MAASTMEDEFHSDSTDFFTTLPPELIFLIIENLELKDFLPCLAVNRRWNSILSDMDLYWRKACKKLGISEEVLATLLTCNHYPSFKSILFALLKQRHSICGITPKHHELGQPYPYFMHYVCQYASGDKFVGTVYKDFQPHNIRMEKLENSSLQTLQTLHPVYQRRSENRTIWATLHREFLLSATASGIWSIYDITTGTIRRNKNSGLVLQWRAESMYDPEIRISSCESCGMVCTAKLVISHLEESFWEVRVVEIDQRPLVDLSTQTKTKLPLPRVTVFRIECHDQEVTSRRNPFARKKIAVLSCSTGTSAKGLCSKHLFLMQWANSITGHVIYYKNDPKSRVCISQTLEHSYTAECSREDYDAAVMRHHGLNSQFSLTLDKQKLGMIFQSSLVTWEVASSRQLSSAPISLKNYHYEEMKLISLGHVYSIVGLEFNSSILILATHTGQQILSCSNFAQQHCRMVPPFIVFISTVDERWLSDISQSCGTVVTYWNKTNRTIEGVEFGVIATDTATQEPISKHKKKRWQRIFNAD